MRNDLQIVRSSEGPAAAHGAREAIDVAVGAHEAKARHAADIGDVSHAVFHGQAALALAIEQLTQEVRALRAEWAARP
jgi:hypothetical protein